MQHQLGHEVYFESVVVGCDDKGVVYIRNHLGSQHIRIKPSDLDKVSMQLQSRADNPRQGMDPKAATVLPKKKQPKERFRQPLKQRIRAKV